VTKPEGVTVTEYFTPVSDESPRFAGRTHRYAGAHQQVWLTELGLRSTPKIRKLVVAVWWPRRQCRRSPRKCTHHSSGFKYRLIASSASVFATKLRTVPFSETCRFTAMLGIPVPAVSATKPLTCTPDPVVHRLVSPQVNKAAGGRGSGNAISCSRYKGRRGRRVACDRNSGARNV